MSQLPGPRYTRPQPVLEYFEPSRTNWARQSRPTANFVVHIISGAIVATGAVILTGLFLTRRDGLGQIMAILPAPLLLVIAIWIHRTIQSLGFVIGCASAFGIGLIFLQLYLFS
jgi:hypothetical protein